MQKINSGADLREAILQLESRRDEQQKILKAQLHLVYESIKPLNFIKSTFKEAAASEDLKDDILNTTLGLATGYVSKILFVGVSHSPLRKLLGTVLMFGVTNVVTKHPEAIKSLGKGVFKIIQGKMIKATESHHNENEKIVS